MESVGLVRSFALDFDFQLKFSSLVHMQMRSFRFLFTSNFFIAHFSTLDLATLSIHGAGLTTKKLCLFEERVGGWQSFNLDFRPEFRPKLKNSLRGSTEPKI